MFRGVILNKAGKKCRSVISEALRKNIFVENKLIKYLEHNPAAGLILGPVIGLLYILALPIVFMLFFVFVAPGLVLAKTDSINFSGDSQMCIGCHSERGLTKKFRNNEEIPVFVKASDFKGSVHGFLECNDCHPNMMSKHPGREFSSREDFLANASRICNACHPPDKLKTKQMHYHAITQAKAPPCAGCHGSHAIKRTSEWKQYSSINQYCLSCHENNLKSSLKGHEMSLHIKEADLKSSVHTNHACTDCHVEFSKSMHPVREFKNKREHSIALSNNCRRCHDDKFGQVQGSIHFSLLKKGNVNAPVCTDCHEFHTVSSAERYATLTGVPCKKCHTDIFNIYSRSVHGMAKTSKHHNAPMCSSCHRAHDIEVTALTDKIKTACLDCHSDAEDAHRKWLPNSALHLENIACAACHSFNAKKGIYLRLVNKNTGEAFKKEEIARLLGTDREGLISKIDFHGDGIDGSEIWDIVTKLNSKGIDAKVTFLGRMDVSTGAEAHQLSFKKDAVRKCEECHSANSDYFTNVSVAIVRADGRPELFKAKQEALGSIFTIFPVSQFYVLGSTRIKFLDIIGLAMVLGGVSLPATHLAIRKLTASKRKKKMEGHR